MVNSDAPAPAPNGGPAATLRVTFAYHGHDLAVTDARRVRMIVPASTAPAPARGQSGYWLELRAGDGRLLFHRVLHSPIRVDVEVFSRGEGQSIARVPVAEPRGEFEVLVPDLPGADSLVLYGPPADPQVQAAPARELLRVGIVELHKLLPDTPASGGGAPNRDRS